MEVEKKHCGFCDSIIVGRTDKKFCNDYCRNSFNNQNPRPFLKHLQEVMSILKQNRRILKDSIDKGNGQPIDKHLLSWLGYDFSYCTEHKELNGHTYYFSFDFGYTVRSNGKIALLRKEQFQQVANSLPEQVIRLLDSTDGNEYGCQFNKRKHSSK